MGQRLTSELVVKLTQQVSGPAAEAKKALAGVDQAMAAIGKRRDAEQRLVALTKAHDHARAKVRDLANALAATDAPSKKMAQSYERAVAAVEKSGQKLAQQRQVIAGAERAMRALVGPTETMAAAETRLRSEAERAASAIAKETAAAQMSARRRASLARELSRAAAEEAAANRRVTQSLIDRRNAGLAVGGAAAMWVGNKAREQTTDTVKRAVDLDLAQRQQVAFGNVAEGDQRGILRPQADRIAQATRFTIPDVLTGQTRILESLPSTFEGETRAAIAKAVTENAVNYALAIPGNIDMETAGHTVIAYLKALNKDISTPEKAAAESSRAVNMMLKASKLSGLNHNDVAEFIRFGGAPGTFAGFSDPFKFAVLAAQKRAGTDGALSGTFMRALAGYSVAPTKKGLGALADVGIDYDSFVKNRKPASGENFAKGLMQRYGIRLSKDQMARVNETMSGTYLDETGAEVPIMSSRDRFVSEVLPIVEESLGKAKNGKTLAADKAKVVKDLNAYFNSTMGDVDVEGLFRAIVAKDPSMQVLNAFLGKEQGGRFIALLQQMKYFEKDFASLGHVPDDFAKKIGDYLMAGLYGSQQNAEGSVETAKTKIGEAWSEKLKVWYDAIGSAGDAISGMSANARLAAGALMGLAAAAGTILGGWALMRGGAALLGFGGKAGGTAASSVGGAIGTGGGLAAVGRGVLRRLGIFGLGVATTEGVVQGARALGYGRGDEAIDETRASLKAQGKDWSPKLQEKMYDEYLSGPGPGRLKQMDDSEMARRKGVPSGVRPEWQGNGQDAGSSMGTGIADGLGRQSSLIEQQAEEIMSRIKSVFAQGVTVPVRVDSAGGASREIASMRRSIHADLDVG